MTRIICALLIVVAAGCGVGGSGLGTTTEALTCIPTNQTCANRLPPAQLKKLVTPGSCHVDTDCKPVFGPDAICAMNNTNTGTVCQKPCGPGMSICPSGTYCDNAFGVCTFKCDGVSTTGPSACTTAGERCGCDGQCAPSCVPVKLVKATVSASPRSLSVLAPPSPLNYGHVMVTITVPDAASAAAAANVALDVVADDGMKVGCSLPSGAISPAAHSCSLAGWGLSSTALSVSRRVNVWLLGAQTKTDHQIKLAGSLVANSPYTIAVHAQTPSPTLGTAADGLYDGIVATQTVSGAAAPDPTTVPVHAYMRSGTLTLVDATDALSPSGLVQLRYPAKTPSTERWFADKRGGGYDVTITPGSLNQVIQGGDVTLGYTVGFPGPQVKNVAYHVRLSPAGSLAACGTGNSCGDGLQCSAGVCLPAPPAPPANSWPFLAMGPDRWFSAALDLLGDSTWIDGNGNYDAAPLPFVGNGYFHDSAAYPSVPYLIHDGYEKESASTWGVTPDQDSDIMGLDLAWQRGNRTPLGADSGYEMCVRDFGPFVIRMIGAGSSIVRPQGFFETCTPPDDGLGTQRYSWIDNQPLTEHAICDRIYAKKIQNADCSLADDATQARATIVRRKTMIPCLFADNSPLGKPANLPASQSCQPLLDRAVRNGNVPAQTTLATYLAQYCEPGGHDLQVTSSGDHLGIEFCPAAASLFGPLKGSAVAERFSCYDPSLNPDVAMASGGVADADIRQTTRLDSREARFSGDLHCAANDRNGAPEHLPLAVPLYFQRDNVYETFQKTNPPPGAPEPPTMQEQLMVQSCLSDLAIVPSDITTAGGDGKHGLAAARSFFHGRACFSPAHFFPAVLGSGLPDRYVLRLLQQYVGVQSFVITHGLKSWSANATIAAGNNCLDKALADPSCQPPPPPPSLDPLMNSADDVWSFFLDARVMQLLESASGADLAAADYRHGGETMPGEDHEQAEGLPVSLVKGLTTYLDGVELYVKHSSDATIEACLNKSASADRTATLARAGAALRRAQVMATVAEDMVDRANLSGKTVAWSGKWTAAREQYLRARARLSSRLRGFLACANSLNIFDSDTPLYFASMPTGLGTNPFAASEYLMTGKASFAITDALAALRAARDALVSESQSLVQQDQATRSIKDRLDDIARRYGTQLMDLCGTAEGSGINYTNILAAFQAGTLKPESCFRNSDRPICDTVNADAKCFHGKLGEAELALIGARYDISLQSQVMDDFIARFDNQDSYCRGLAIGYGENAELMTEHNNLIKEARKGFNFLSALGDFVEGAVGLVATIATGGAMAPIDIALMGSKAVAKDAHDSLDNQQLDYDQMMAQRKDQTELDKCNHDADQQFIGIKTAGMTAVRRGLDAEEAMLRLKNMEDQVRELVAEGSDAFNTENARTALPIAHTFWYDEYARTFSRKFLWAQRLTYLAVQAVAYEYQQPLGSLRKRVLTATSPVELDEVRQSLDAITSTHMASDNVQYDTKIYVFPMRDETNGANPRASLLSVDTRMPLTTDPKANIARFRALLTSPDNAVYDKDGLYQGQSIHFRITPDNISGTLGLHDTCGERLWQVAAQIATDQTHLADNVALKLRKANTFYSQTCTAATDPQHYQVASISAATNPFASDDPNDVSSLVGSVKNISAGPERFTQATLMASHIQADLQKLEDGTLSAALCSDVFADSGLFGDYELLIPWDAALVAGFDLNQVTQITFGFQVFEADNTSQGGTWPPGPPAPPLVP